jgi:carotenoid cleavage dioxygenase-like enzyme
MSATIHEPPAERNGGATYFAPVAAETQAFDLPVLGAIPAELHGRFVRNGPNPRSGRADGHPFLADGMLHGLRIEDGTARWYRNRWVRTKSFTTGAKYVNWFGRVDLQVGTANTNVIAHGGKLLALVESSFPYEITADLDTVGPFDFGKRLKTPFTAHPKRCPRTGELHAYGMKYVRGGLTYHRIDAAGTLVESRPIPVAGVTMMHDFALTERHVVFMDLPMVFDLARAKQGEMPFAWSETYGARLGVMRRDDARGAVRWFDIEPCYVFHVMNARDDGESLVLDAVRYDELWRKDARSFERATLHRWTIDMAADAVRELALDDARIEFPRIDERRLGSAYRIGYAVQTHDDRRTIVRYDLVRGGSTQRDFGAGRFAGEPVFVPKSADAAEEAGWLMAFVYDAGRDASELVILDAGTLETAAAVALPQRVPFGFHGNWIGDVELA